MSRPGYSTSTLPNQSGTTWVSLTNFGNAELSDVEVAAAAGGEEFDRNFLFDVAPGASQTTTFDTENVSADRVTFTATYTAAGDQHTTQETVTLQNVKQVDGEIRLTSVETTRTGSSVTIEGDAANVGSTDTESVLVSIPNESGVRPVAPSGEYFIGAIEASEFATFELTGEVDAGTSAVPVDITYIVDGERVTTTQDVNLGSGGGAGAGTAGDGQTGGDAQNPASGTGGPDGQAGSGGLPLLPPSASSSWSSRWPASRSSSGDDERHRTRGRRQALPERRGDHRGAERRRFPGRPRRDGHRDRALRLREEHNASTSSACWTRRRRGRSGSTAGT